MKAKAKCQNVFTKNTVRAHGERLKVGSTSHRCNMETQAMQNSQGKHESVLYVKSSGKVCCRSIGNSEDEDSVF